MNFSITVAFVLHIMLVCAEKRIVFFGRHASDDKNIDSSLDFAYEKFRKDMTMSIQRIWQFLSEIEKINSIAPEMKSVHEDFHFNVKQFPRIWECNDNIINRLVMQRRRYLIKALEQHESSPHFLEEGYNWSTSSYDSFPQLIGHLARDWSDAGTATREKIYINGVLLPLELNPVHTRNNQTVLVPGAGMGRLAVEIAAMGYRVEANECSGAMVSALHSIVTDILPRYKCNSYSDSNRTGVADQDFCRCPEDVTDSSRLDSPPYKFFPYAHFVHMDEWDFDQRFRPSVFPSRDAAHLSEWIRNAESGGQLSIQFGDFLAIYSEGTRKNSFDVVVTCFFIDTASDILDYISVITHVLKPGGLWINAGPLHYHTAKTTFPYSQKYLERVTQTFGFVEEAPRRILEATYCSEEEAFMKPDYYSCPLNTWRLERKRDDITGMFSCNRKYSSSSQTDNDERMTTTAACEAVNSTDKIKRKKVSSTRETADIAREETSLYEPSVNYVIL